MATKRYLAPWGRAAAAAWQQQQGEAGAAAREALAALEGKPALYHCVSRVVWREMALADGEKEQFVRMLRKWEAFAQVRVLTFCIMTNHFHLLVEVPERPPQEPGDAALLEHLGLIYGAGKLAEICWELEHHRSQGNHGAAEALRQRFLRRMWDLSSFMKDLKQDFTVWWNRRHGKKGHLWERRFHSVLVEDGHAARVVAAYIDLNPVRAGMAAVPEAYRWSGWGRAVAGQARAREGIRLVMLERELARSAPEVALAEVEGWRKTAAAYRGLMQADLAWDGEAPAGGRAMEPAGSSAARKTGGRGLAARGGAMAEAELLRRRVRYFVDGMAIGSREFVEGVFGLTREWFGSARASGARKLRRVETPLRSLRDLRVEPYG